MPEAGRRKRIVFDVCIDGAEIGEEQTALLRKALWGAIETSLQTDPLIQAALTLSKMGQNKNGGDHDDQGEDQDQDDIQTQSRPAKTSVPKKAKKTGSGKTTGKTVTSKVAGKKGKTKKPPKKGKK